MSDPQPYLGQKLAVLAPTGHEHGSGGSRRAAYLD